MEAFFVKKVVNEIEKYRNVDLALNVNLLRVVFHAKKEDFVKVVNECIV